ncbi:D-2-hydroxyacid dehydrogenase [Evansella sp. AB-rgal1]|uniref:D-2-hydroxyacid dehydrogenase n=1 Tax=Evansella sp. AB-rgal1 TaxID=3242696 RepID=UPI00359CFD7F
MKITNILITGKIYKELEEIMEREGYEELRGKQLRFRAEGEVTEDDLEWSEAFVSFRPTPNFYFGKNLKWVHSLGAGVDRYMSLGIWKQGIPLTRTVCSFGERISEYSLSYVLRDLQFHETFAQHQAVKQWNEFTPIPLKEIRLIVFGTGEIGHEVARAFSSFGVKVYGVSLSGKQKSHFEKVIGRENLSRDFLQGADYIINTLPLTSYTDKLFGEEFFNELKNAVFINCGRGASVDHSALRKALDNGNLKSAVLDVFEVEPLPTTDPLWDNPKVTITPHISAVTTPEEAVACFVDTLSNIEGNRELENEVDLTKEF